MYDVTSVEIQSGLFTGNVAIEGGRKVEKGPHPNAVLTAHPLALGRYQFECDRPFRILLSIEISILQQINNRETSDNTTLPWVNIILG